MTDHPSITERYATADRPNDVIGAAGMAARSSKDVALAVSLWGLLFGGKTINKHQVADGLAENMNRQMGRDRRLKGDAWKIAKEMLAWWCDGVCTACDGRGYEAIQGTPSLSDNLCSHCHGSGKRPYPRDAAHIWMEQELGRLTAIGAAEVMKKLAKAIDL